jgi:hypothetical protein
VGPTIPNNVGTVVHALDLPVDRQSPTSAVLESVRLSHTFLTRLHRRDGCCWRENTPLQRFDPVELAATVASRHGTDFVLREPSDPVVRVAAVLAPHAPAEPLRERERRKGAQVGAVATGGCVGRRCNTGARYGATSAVLRREQFHVRVQSPQR